jgi:hypothetical protein
MSDVVALRRWVRRTQSAHRERGETFGNFYMGLLLVLIVGGMFHSRLQGVFWPGGGRSSWLAGVSWMLVGFGVLYLVLRRIGPLALSRPAASWLLTAPVSRRRLLLPSLRGAAIGAAIVGGLAGLGILGHAAPRPIPPVLLLAGALLGVGVLLIAYAVQPLGSAVIDNAGSLVVALGLAGLVVDAATAAPRADFAWPPATVVVAVVGAFALVVALFFALSVRRLASTPNDRILDASKTAGTLADAAFGVEPSFVTEMVERRYWAGRRLRSVRLWGRVPVLVAQDLILMRRRPRRLLWLAGATALPVLLVAAPSWLRAIAVLLGGMIAGGTTTATVRSDAGNPVLLRLLGLSSRATIAQRLWVPALLAGLWYAISLTLLARLGHLAAGPWWALGLALAPVGAIAAVRRARVGFVDNGLLPLDTPMGTIATGPTLSAVIGFDALILGVVVVVQFAQGSPLTWTTVVIQAVVGGLALRGYLRSSTSPERVELSERR